MRRPFSDECFIRIFAEGCLFKASVAKNEIAKLELQDDDSLGMELFCRVAHHHVLSKTEEDGLATQDIGAFVLACHKYGCLEKFTFKSAAERWLLASLRHEEKDWDDDALIVAYMVDNQSIFDDVTKELILRSTEAFEPNGKMTTEFGPFTLPDRIISESESPW